LNIQQLRYFLAICDEHSFTRAARKCGVSQPSMTTAIQRLEREIGGALFIRSTPVKLSALGTSLRPVFAQIDSLSATARRIAAAHRAPGRLRMRAHAGSRPAPQAWSPMVRSRTAAAAGSR